MGLGTHQWSSATSVTMSWCDPPTRAGHVPERADAAFIAATPECPLGGRHLYSAHERPCRLNKRSKNCAADVHGSTTEPSATAQQRTRKGLHVSGSSRCLILARLLIKRLCCASCQHFGLDRRKPWAMVITDPAVHRWSARVIFTRILRSSEARGEVLPKRSSR